MDIYGLVSGLPQALPTFTALVPTDQFWEIPQNATYTWTLTGAGVELKAVTDRCADRDSSLTGTWQRAS